MTRKQELREIAKHYEMGAMEYTEYLVQMVQCILRHSGKEKLVLNRTNASLYNLSYEVEAEMIPRIMDANMRHNDMWQAKIFRDSHAPRPN